MSAESAIAQVQVPTYTAGETDKVFDATIDVANPTHFCTQKIQHLTNEIDAKFVGRCYKGALIVRNIRVLRASACRINDSNGAGEGVVDVQFAATVREFCRWDIITGVEIRIVAPVIAGHYTIRNGGKAEAQAFVVLQHTKGIESLAVGQRIPVRITKAEHPVRQAAVVYGALLTCDGAAITYRLRGSLDAATAAEMMPMVNHIEQELKQRAALVAEREKAVAFFESLLYSYKGPTAISCSHSVQSWPTGPEWRGPPPLKSLDAGLAVRSIPELVREVAQSSQSTAVAGLWSRPLSIHRSAPIAAFAETSSAQPGSAQAYLDESPRVVFALFLKNILDFLVATREMATDYESPESDESYSGLWAAMRLAQV